jgi:uncharacterized protein YbbC (DUF1343 family)
MFEVLKLLFVKITQIMSIRLFLIFSFFISISFYGINQDSQFTTQFKSGIKVGAERLELYLPKLEGKRVGVVANQTSIVGSSHLVDSLLSLGISVKKVFSPEHGFRGTASAGEHVRSSKDIKTGLPIVSLYGSNKKPTVSQLQDLDILIFDIQDVGARFYTYISTLHYVMEAAAENKLEVIVLDRPNPNGFYVDGPVLKNGFESFVGMHPIPVVHGLTVGELATMINGENWLKNKVQCKLTVVSCENYSHSDFYELPVPPSPNLPNMSSIYLYPSLCFFEGTSVSVGRGTELPFQVIGSPFIDSGSYEFVPKSTIGAAHPKHENKQCVGYNLSLFGLLYVRNTRGLYLHWLVGMNEKTTGTFLTRPDFFDKLAGTDELRKQLENKSSIQSIKQSWEKELNSYKIMRSKYLLYPDFE